LVENLYCLLVGLEWYYTWLPN